MTASEKSKNRLMQSWAGFWLVVFMVVCGVALLSFNKSIDGYVGLVSIVTIAVFGKDGASFFSTPKDN